MGGELVPCIKTGKVRVEGAIAGILNQLKDELDYRNC